MASKIEIRGPSGFGDAIYMNSIANAFHLQYEKVLVRTKYPEIFKYIPGVEPVAFKKGGADLEFNYGGRRRNDQTTTQWKDLLITSGLDKNTPYQTIWKLTNTEIINTIQDKSQGKKLLVVSAPHIPFDRLDQFGLELIPNYKKFIPLIKMARDKGYYIIQLGRGKCIFDFGKNMIDLDLKNKTTVCDMMDIGMIGDLFLGQCGNIVPLAEGYKKKLFIVFSQKGLNSNTEFLKNITGRKICSTEKSNYAIDSMNDDEIMNLFEVKCL